jgi:hypothetical protein
MHARRKSGCVHGRSLHSHGRKKDLGVSFCCWVGKVVAVAVVRIECVEALMDEEWKVESGECE